MDGLRLPSYRKEFQKDDGLSRSLDSGSDPQWIEVCHPTGGGVVTWARTAAQTSNYGRTTLDDRLSRRTQQPAKRQERVVIRTSERNLPSLPLPGSLRESITRLQLTA